MKAKQILPFVACGLALAGLPAFANEDGDAGSKLKKLDTNHDGRVSRSEFVTAKQEKIQRLDANGDGIVTAAESAAVPQKKHWWSRSEEPMESVSRADANGDGQITSAETIAYADAAFGYLDTDADGFLTEAELAAGMKK